jgi:hypothetical protein
MNNFEAASDGQYFPSGQRLVDGNQLFSLWRSGIKSRSIASLVFASNPLGEAGSWLIGAL